MKYQWPIALADRVALNADGKPVASYYINAVRWVQ